MAVAICQVHKQKEYLEHFYTAALLASMLYVLKQRNDVGDEQGAKTVVALPISVASARNSQQSAG